MSEVEELKKIREKANDDMTSWYGTGRKDVLYLLSLIANHTACEICEWKYWGDNCKDEVYTIECGRNITYLRCKDEKYCPYCGKEIKVIK